MQLIHHHLHDWDRSLPQIPVHVDRLTLSKRRWRGEAQDGTEFGFDLEHHLDGSDVIFQSEKAIYLLRQTPEPVLEIALAAAPAPAARLGWLIGNLHFPLEVADAIIRVADDPALRQLFEREHIAFSVRQSVFRPISGGHHHH